MSASPDPTTELARTAGQAGFDASGAVIVRS